MTGATNTTKPQKVHIEKEGKTMTRKGTDRNTYRVVTGKSVYFVTLERIKNDRCGNARYNASIIDTNSPNLDTVTYNFGGHYCGEQEEADYIVKRYEAE